MAVFVAMWACDRAETAGQSPAVTIQDSAGIQIVESHAPQWDEADSWTVAAEPEIVIGGYRGADQPPDSSHLVWDIRDVVPLSDGRVAMLYRGEKKVLVFESSGVFFTSIGRVGRGPGEFSNPEHLQVLPGDTMDELPPRESRPPIVGLLVDSLGYLWVKDSYSLDRSGSEWSVFDPAGHWLGTLEIPLGRVEWIGENLILGVNQDPDTGVQVVEGFRLSR